MEKTGDWETRQNEIIKRRKNRQHRTWERE